MEDYRLRQGIMDIRDHILEVRESLSIAMSDMSLKSGHLVDKNLSNTLFING